MEWTKTKIPSIKTIKIETFSWLTILTGHRSYHSQFVRIVHIEMKTYTNCSCWWRSDVANMTQNEMHKKRKWWRDSICRISKRSNKWRKWLMSKIQLVIIYWRQLWTKFITLVLLAENFLCIEVNTENFVIQNARLMFCGIFLRNSLRIQWSIWRLVLF